jgi:hypothetical protein
MVNAFGRKKSHSWKVNYSPSRKDQNRIRNAKETHASNDGNMVVEVGIQRYRLHKHKKQQRSFYESI